jgi:hypothetical protein
MDKNLASVTVILDQVAIALNAYQETEERFPTPEFETERAHAEMNR